MITEKRVKELAEECLKHGNPYKAKATEYYRGSEPMYLCFGKSMTAEEIDEAYLDTAMHDIRNGYNERMVGYYDKWYRYSHMDEGRAYDYGVREAVKNPKCAEEMRIIECMQ